jgi:hypothetical protein
VNRFQIIINGADNEPRLLRFTEDEEGNWSMSEELTLGISIVAAIRQNAPASDEVNSSKRVSFFIHCLGRFWLMNDFSKRKRLTLLQCERKYSCFCCFCSFC